ncbi:MAG: biliverdin-producing heme oxygenase [Phycisphaeraceae bacterium]|nr:biliverdin-producing heme oxygenase [Phycisphaeraceae bacterium]
MTTSAPVLGLADTLKTQTQAAHTAAERHEFQGRVLRGMLGTDGYAAQMGQYYLAHKALTDALARASADPRIAALIRSYHAYPQLFEADLRHFGIDPSSVRPLASTQRIVAEISAADPLALLGFTYVAEGSTNGGKYIGQALRRALNVPNGEGLSSLDPHGEAQRERWHEFRGGLDQLKLEEASRLRLIAAADRYFAYVIELFDELSKAFPANPANLPLTR